MTGMLVITSWRALCSIACVFAGITLGSFETVFGERDPTVYLFCSGMISLGLGLKVDDTLHKDKTNADSN